jgi:hypothetical protein
MDKCAHIIGSLYCVELGHSTGFVHLVDMDKKETLRVQNSKNRYYSGNKYFITGIMNDLSVRKHHIIRTREYGTL